MSAVAATYANPLATVLADGLEQLRLSVETGAEAKLLRFVAQLQKWNHAYNLTSVRDPRDMLVVHVLDSLSIIPLLETLQPARILDVGSGAGLPGIPLAIARAAWHVDSVDAVAKKIAFQRQMATELALPNLTPHHARVEVLTVDESPDVIVSRAYASLAEMLASVEQLAGPATRIVAMKGVVPSDELRALQPRWTLETLATLDVPYLGAQRCAVVLRRDESPPR